METFGGEDVHQGLPREASAGPRHDGGEETQCSRWSRRDDLWDLNCLLINDARVAVCVVVVVVVVGALLETADGVVVNAHVFLLLLGRGGGSVGMNVSRLQAGEDRVIEGVVEAGTKGIFSVELVANVASLDPGVGVLRGVEVGVGTGLVDSVSVVGEARASSSCSGACSQE